MKAKQKRIKLQKRRHHTANQPARLREALASCQAKAKHGKKDDKFIKSEMEKLGWVPDGRGGYRRMAKIFTRKVIES